MGDRKFLKTGQNVILENILIFAYDIDILSVQGWQGGKEVNGMVSDEELYRRYVNGDETGLDELMKKGAESNYIPAKRAENTKTVVFATVGNSLL